MITPNKVVSLDDSVIGRISWILRGDPKDCSVIDLFYRLSDRFESIDQFILALDVLFVLGRIDVDLEKKMVTYVA